MSNIPPPEVTSAAPMPPVTTGQTEQVNIRIPHDHIKRCQTVRDALIRPGLAAPSMSEVYRAIMAKGLEAWEEELGIKSPSGASAPTKKKPIKGR